MTMKKFFAGLLATSMVAASVPVLNIAAAGLPKDVEYLYEEDFEDGTWSESYTNSSTGARWTGAVVTLSGNKLIKYTRDTSVKYPDGTTSYKIFGVGFGGSNSVLGGDIDIESNKIYQGGFKVDYNGMTGYMPGTPSMSVAGAYGRCNTSLGSMGLNGGRLSWGNIFSENISDIKGFVEVEFVIETGDLTTKHPNGNNKYVSQANATVTTYVRYTKTNGDEKEHKEVRNITTMDSDGYCLDRFTGFSASEWTSSTTQDVSIYMDDIYFREVPTFKTNFHYNDSYNGSKETVVEAGSNLQSNVTLPSPENRVEDSGDATYAEFEFDGWYLDKDSWQEPFDGIGLESDVDAYAKWLNVYKIKYDLNDISDDYDPELPDGVLDYSRVREDERVIRGELAEPTLYTYQFEGWYLDPECTPGNEFDGTFTDKPQNMTVYASWLIGKKITFLAPDADSSAERVTYQYPAEYLRPSEIFTPTRIGWEFLGWYLSDADGNFITDADGNKTEVNTALEITEGMYAAADWKRMHKITLKLNGGALEDGLDSVVYTFDTDAEVDTIDIDTIPIPKKEGNTFEGWCTDKDCKALFDGNVDGDMTLYARYNDVLFYEDFEYEGDELDAMNEKLMKNFSSTSWQALLKEGAGIVTDPDDEKNQVLRLPKANGGRIDFKFDKGGEGLYEFTFRVRQNEAQTNYNLIRPRTGTTDWAGANFWGFQLISVYNNNRMNIWDSGKAWGWVDMTIRYDTVNDVISYFGKWQGVVSGNYSGKMVNQPFTPAGEYIDGFSIAYTSSGPEGNLTNIYVDDYKVRKIDLADVESITFSDGKTGDNQKDIPINSKIELCFDRVLDESTITSSTVTLSKVKDGVKTAVKASVVKETKNGKTMATIIPEQPLEKGMKYEVDISKKITERIDQNTPHVDPYSIVSDLTYSFTTVPEKFYISATLLTADGSEEVESLAEQGGQQVQAVLNLRYPSGEKATENYFVGVALVDMTIDSVTGKPKEKQLAYQAVSGEIAKGGEMNVVQDGQSYTALLSIPESVTEDYKIRFYVWDTLKGDDYLNAGWNVIEFPQ